MMDCTVDFFEYGNCEYENPKTMNRDVGQTSGPYMAFLDKSATNRQEVALLLEKSELLGTYDAVVFGDGILDGEAGLLDMLQAFEMDILGFVVKRQVLEETGCFNEKLETGISYEFLCRVSACRTIYCIPCKRENIECGHIQQISPKVLAYILKRYMVELRKKGALDVIFSRMNHHMEQEGQLHVFCDCLNTFLDGTGYSLIAENTAPFFVVSGDDTCYGVLKEFASCLADALAALGQAVITTDHKHGRFHDYDEIERMQFKGVIGFQAPVLEKEFFRKVQGRKLQFWLDNPAFFNDMFHNLTDDYYLLCQDDYYAKHLKQFYHVKHALQLPPAGRECGHGPDVERCYDIVFVGTYKKPDMSCIQDTFQKEYFEYFIEHPRFTFEEGLQAILLQKNINIQKDKFLDILWSLLEVNRLVINCFRRAVIEQILSAGYTIHVFGDSWNEFDSKYAQQLVIHPAVSGDSALQVLNQAKISLNVMSWHKTGMTERIANSMLAGAVCLSDETVYLRQNFAEDEELVLYSLDKLEELPGRIDKLSQDESYRNHISQRAYEKAAREHTWEQRARQLLELLDR